MVLTADSILVRSTRRRQTSTGWNTAYIGANRYTLSPDEKPPPGDALHPMAFLVEKGPGAVTRPHFHQADQFQVVVAGRGMLGDREFSDGAVLHRCVFGLWTDRRRKVGHLVVYPAQPLGPRRPVYAGRAAGA